MIKLANVIYCLNVQKNQVPGGNGNTINAIGVVSVLTPEYIPGTFSFSVIFTLLGVDVKKENTVQIIFSKNGDDNPLVDTGTVTLSSIAEDNADNLPAEYQGIDLCMDFRNVVFESNGVYKTTIYFNNEELGCREIYVKGRR